MLVSVDALQNLYGLHIDILMLRALTRDTRNDPEREQALKLVRVLVDRSREWGSLPPAFIRLFVSAAEQPDEKLRDICVETLCELAIQDTAALALSGGMKALFWALSDCPPDLCECVLMAIVVVLDREETRRYVRAGFDVETIVSPITNSLGSPPSDEQLQQASRSLQYLFKTWTGLIYLCYDDKRVVKAVVEAVKLPSDAVRTVVLDMLFEIFLLPNPSDQTNFVECATQQSSSSTQHEDLLMEHLSYPPLNEDGPRLLDNYLAVVLVVFIESGLFNALIEVIQGPNTELGKKATGLLGEILDLCGRVLPKSYGPNVFTLPELFDVASDFRQESRRHTATAALAHIGDRRRSKEDSKTSLIDVSVIGHASQFARSRRVPKRLAHFEYVKIRVGLQIDEDRFRVLLGNTGVLALKDYTKWNWDAIMELVQGPLYHVKRFEEVLRNTKLIKRLLAFYRPANRQFSSIQKETGAAKYVRIGSELLSVLVSNPEGFRYLVEDPLLAQIAQCLMQLDPLYNASMPPQAEPVFSRDRMEKTLTSYYFHLLGTLSRTTEGISILERFKIFDLFYHMTELKSRDDIAKAIVLNLDYRNDGHPRVLLSKVLTSGYKLYDPSLAVCEMAAKVLEEVCSNRDNLEAMIQLRPTVDHMGNIGEPLLLNTMGFTYLSELNYIETQMERWFELELSLASAVMGYSNSNEDSAAELVDNERDSDHNVPPHFYGELTKTAEGCDLLRKKEHFIRFVEYVRRLPADADLEPENISKLKAVLWAVGHVGTSEMGHTFLSEANIIVDIVALAESSPVLSVRGTSFCVLGLISMTGRGAEVLDSLGWHVVLNHKRSYTGLCVPRDFSKILKVRPCEYRASVADGPVVAQTWERHEPLTQEVLRCVGDMPNNILATGASKTIARIRHDHPDIFARSDVYLDVQNLLSTYSYRMTARRYLAELFGNFEFNEQRFAEMDSVVSNSAVIV
ncbi:hypothetical protein HDU93_007910 [Gonapodya sp. JEL0774]|nr:hypothetical protein HDU93_007910 [Gonapodya sp. JEL0774]